MALPISEFDQTKRGVLNFIKSWDLDTLVKKQGGKIQEMHDKRTMALEGDESIPRNTKLYLNWFMPTFYGEYGRKVGISKKSHEDKLLPGKGM